MAPLQWVRDHWLKPYVRSDHVAVEIGPGGGRWTRYLLGFQQVYAVDYYSEVLGELRKRFSSRNVTFVLNHGTDFPGVPAADFVFSFGTFVHLDPPLIQRYIENVRQVLKSSGEVVIQYADKAKPIAAANESLSDMSPEQMRSLVLGAGFEVREEDTATLWHSALIRFGWPHSVSG
jgi:SAM-dependent methyltransferase